MIIHKPQISYGFSKEIIFLSYRIYVYSKLGSNLCRHLFQNINKQIGRDFFFFCKRIKMENLNSKMR